MAGPLLKSGQARQSSQYNGNRSGQGFEDILRNLNGKVLSGRILNIDQSGTNTNGTATVQLLQSLQLQGKDSVNGVLPFFPNIKNYPLVNEIVLILPLANVEFVRDFDDLTFYYVSPLNLWNSNQSNPLPYPKEQTKSNTQEKSYQEVEIVGNPNKPSPVDSTPFKPGTYFNEDNIPNPTYPYEGDYILDGRFGNSLRFGNTVPTGSSNVTNNWSTVGKTGDPITILTNRKHTSSPSFNFITENINLDGSSAYFTSTQQIPIEVSSQNSYLSYTTPPTYPNTYSGEQIILNSGRLLFNSTQDHILLSSQKSINLNSQESVNVDARTEMVIQTPELYLGGKETSQPIVLGNDLVKLLNKVLEDLESLTGVLTRQQVTAVGTPLAPTSLVAKAINSKIGTYQAELSNVLSNTTKTV
jgi:hypothetical protein